LPIVGQGPRAQEKPCVVGQQVGEGQEPEKGRGRKDDRLITYRQGLIIGQN
jgi:hypothetical protein